MQCVSNNTELSSHEGTCCQFNGSKAVIKLGIDVHQDLCRGRWCEWQCNAEGDP